MDVSMQLCGKAAEQDKMQQASVGLQGCACAGAVVWVLLPLVVVAEQA